MSKIFKNINKELYQSICKSQYNSIDYETLLINNPISIRDKEQNLALNEPSFEIPKQLKVSNITITSINNNNRIKCRLYQPKKKDKLPIYLFFHGGAFIYGTPKQYDFILCRLAIETNMLIVSVDYRLAPENPFPVAMEDGYEVLIWLTKHASKIGGDSENIIIGGSSAGATIAASITHLVRDKRTANILHQYLLYPPLCKNLLTDSMKNLANAPMQTKTAAKWMWKHYLQNNFDSPPKYAVPLLEKQFNNLPNTTIIVCELDPLKDEGKLYANKLKSYGISVNLLEIKGAVHAFDFFECTLSDNFYKQQISIFNKILKNLK